MEKRIEEYRTGGGPFIGLCSWFDLDECLECLEDLRDLCIIERWRTGPNTIVLQYFSFKPAKVWNEQLPTANCQARF